MVLRVVLVLALLGACSAIPSAPRIINGTTTSIDAHPGVVSIESSDNTSGEFEAICVGSVLNEVYVLTTARCLANLYLRPQNVRVRAGSNQIGEGGTVVGVQSIILHPEFRLNPVQSWDSDVALIRLSAFLTFSANIQPTSIISQNFFLPENVPVLYVAWGERTIARKSKSSLRKVKLIREDVDEDEDDESDDQEIGSGEGSSESSSEESSSEESSSEESSSEEDSESCEEDCDEDSEEDIEETVTIKEMQQASLVTVNQQLCVDRYAPISQDVPTNIVTHNMFCAGLLNVGGQGPCAGDYGAPVFYSGVLVGLYSWEENCADAYYPVVNTMVSSYTNWIVANAV